MSSTPPSAAAPGSLSMLTMSLTPSLLLAAAPVWHVFINHRTLSPFQNIHRIYKMALALALLGAELSQLRARCRLYETQPRLAILAFLLTIGSFSYAFLSRNRAIKLHAMATSLIDAMLVFDMVKGSFLVLDTKLSGNMLLLTLSVLRTALLVFPLASQVILQVYEPICKIAVISGVRYIWQSPFSLMVGERIEDLGLEFNAESLMQRFSLVWSLYHNPPVPHYALLWATLWTLKWEFALIYIIRCCVAAAALTQPHAIQTCLTIIQRRDASTRQEYTALTLLLFAFLGALIFKRVLTRLSHRYSICLHTMLSGEAMEKSFRLRGQRAQDRISVAQVNESIEKIIEALPICANGMMSSIELGVTVSYLWHHVGVTSLVCFVSFLLTVVPSSRLLPTIESKRVACEQSSRNRVLQSEKIFSQAKGIKATGNQVTMSAYLRSLHQREVDAIKRMRFFQMFCASSQEFVTSITPIALLFGAVTWTNSSHRIQPSVLFAIMTAARIVSVRLDNIFSGYQHVDILLRSYRRTQDFLCYEEHRSNRVVQRPIKHQIVHSSMNYMALPSSASQVDHCHTSAPNQDQLQLHNVNIIAPGGVSPLLHNVTVSIPRGKLTVVIGITASGKTQFLKALLDELEHVDGDLFLERNTSVAYCDEKVWLQNKSVKDNILGGNPLDENRYDAVIEKCQLRSDFNSLPQGDQTLVSTGAVNLSTSQQHKMALARGVYSPASVLILDDPFKILDRETADCIFKDLLEDDGFIRKEQRTVVLATSFRRYLADADLAIILDGRGNVITREGGESFPVNSELRGVIRQLTYAAPHSLPIKTSVSASHPGNTVPIQPSVQAGNENVDHATILAALLTLVSKRSVLLFCLISSFAALAVTLADGLGGLWVEKHLQNSAYFLKLLFLTGIVPVSALILWIVCFQYLVPSLCNAAHEKLVDTVMNARISYLAAANHCEVLSLLSKDITSVARKFGLRMLQATFYSISAFTNIVFVTILVPKCGFAVMGCVMGLIYLIRNIYLPICQQSAQLQQQTSMLLLTHIREISSGVEHIRAFGWQQQFRDRGILLLNRWQAPFLHHLDVTRWLDFILNLAVALASILIVVMGMWTESISSSQVGASLLMLGSMPGNINFMVVACTQMQSQATSLIRLVEAFKNTPKEPDEAKQQGFAPSLDMGSIELHSVKARYGEDADAKAVIDCASMKISAGQKAILIGKSASGKSSVILSILNFLNYTGTIKIGDSEISTIPLADLRTQISVMPPEFLDLPGTVEQNLLPWRLMDDAEDNISNETIHQVLKHVCLRMHIHNSGGLQMLMKDLKLSDGQKTQFAMARLVFHHLHYENKIVLMDEPTGGLDDAMRLHLDQLIENYFEGSTVLTVSRDPESITHADVVFYMDEGEIHQ